jgi:hypothetical protein
MIRIDANFIYKLGASIHPVQYIRPNATKRQVLGHLVGVSEWLDILLNKSVFRLVTSRIKGSELHQTVKRICDSLPAEGPEMEDTLDWLDHHLLTNQARDFETILAAELQWGQLFLVQPKGGYELHQLTENGTVIFPSTLAEKVPEAVQDATEAARCIAFELPTAAAFHLHRVHELVLRRYYDTVTGGKTRPEKRNIGAYISAMKAAQVGDKKVFSALAGLKDFHRNPVLHPDDHLDDVEEVLALLGNINTVITYMLKAIQPPSPESTQPPQLPPP